MPNTREKLTDLISTARFDVERICDERMDCEDCPAAVHEGECKAGYIADHLIANDVVPVVRCNNCQKRTKSNWCNLLMMEVKGDNFCSYGERKTDNGRS